MRPTWLIVTLQAEVAESIAAQPGRMSYLSVEMQTLVSAKVLFYLPPKAFKPPPKVRSAVVRLDVLDTSEAEVDDREAFPALVRAGLRRPGSVCVTRWPSACGPSLRRQSRFWTRRASMRIKDRLYLTLPDWQGVYFAWRSQDGGKSQEPEVRAGSPSPRRNGAGWMKTVAPAKINWTLEVLGRREDGYHEIRSVMQTIDLCDELWAERSDVPSVRDDCRKAARRRRPDRSGTKALEERVGRALPARIRVEKRIPVASGLGGGSRCGGGSAAAQSAARDWALERRLAGVGAEVGSDVPFFIYGGTALVEGRGERVTPLFPIVEGAWLTIVVPGWRYSRKRQHGCMHA